MKGVRFVLFDAVGTLIHARTPVAEVYHSIGRRYGSRLTVEEIRQSFADALACYMQPGPTDELRERARWQAIVAEVLNDIAESSSGPFEELWEAFARPEQWSLYADVAPVWSGMQARGRTLGIASNFDSRLVGLCQALPPLASAAHCFISSQLGFSKPHGEFFRGIESRLGAKPEEILLVGDSLEHDVAGARRAGWQAIHLQRGVLPAASGSIASLTELLELL